MEKVVWDDQLRQDSRRFRSVGTCEGGGVDLLGSVVAQSKGVILKDELRNLRLVLKRLGYVSEDDIVQVKVVSLQSSRRRTRSS